MMVNQRPSFLLEEKLTYKLRGIFIEISKQYGCLFKEKVYQKLLVNEFNKNKIQFICYPNIPIFSLETGKKIGECYPDFLVNDKILIEVKAQNQILNNHINQLLRYLNISKYEIGLLVNFGSPKVQIIRRIYTNDKKPFLK